MTTATIQAPHRPSLRATGRKFLYVITGGVILLMTLWGFRSYYLHGMGAGDTPLLSEMVRLDAIH
ncbi:hypothetical protein GRI89_12185 [Altererythrobacter salegens]|uniref:Uncharacterized protein n=1 Tax=Croceibacterium salegens TaxID=1737568 RepID=A0A6I4SZ40_9SPHN|nr:hypothetical protein [Croceibacterium salegens]MXO60297.1 hypothetical protein [Croceibacterium salegens]